jgi:2-dehydro-3-deoxyphosphogluconate aldolase / (4S)-4-hydroxy-2-oxoglutarate aldolase
MTIDDVVRRIGEVGIIPVIRAATVDDATRAIEAICAGGIPVVEITMTVPNAVAVIREVSQQYAGKVLVGAGTVTSTQQAEQCVRAGAEFLVSPGLSMPMMLVARECAKLGIPGALTPTELMQAQEHGASLVKIFPCGNVGGPRYLKSLKAPFPHTSLIPTGGVNAANAGEFIQAGAFALGVGADLVDATALRNGNLAKITASSQELVHAVNSARQALLERKAL